MQLCFPVKKNEGLQSPIYGHFGLAPLLLVVDTETQDIVELDNSRFREFRGPVRFENLFGDQQVDALVVQDIGQGAMGHLLAAEIKIYKAEGVNIADNILCLADNRLHEFTLEDSHMNGQGKGLGRGQGQGLGSGRGQGQGLGRGQQQEMGRGQGRGLNCNRGQGLGQGQGLGSGRGQGQGLGRGQGSGRALGQGRRNGINPGA